MAHSTKLQFVRNPEEGEETEGHSWNTKLWFAIILEPSLDNRLSLTRNSFFSLKKGFCAALQQRLTFYAQNFGIKSQQRDLLPEKHAEEDCLGQRLKQHFLIQHQGICPGPSLLAQTERSILHHLRKGERNIYKSKPGPCQCEIKPQLPENIQ